MTAAGARSHRLDVRLLMLRRPELAAMAVIALAWVTIVMLALGGLGGDSRAPGMPGMAGMPGSGPAASYRVLPAVADGLAGWILMCVAMMGPGALAGIRHTGINSLRWRRGRAMTEFAVAYLGVWAAFGAVALALSALAPSRQRLGVLALVLALAAAWQVTRFKRRALRDCHRSVPLPLRGWRAEWGALRFGLRNSLSCVGSCWCLMLVMIAVPGGYLLWMIVLTGIVTVERLLERPRQATRFAAAAMGIAATIAFGAACNAGLLA